MWSTMLQSLESRKMGSSKSIIPVEPFNPVVFVELCQVPTVPVSVSLYQTIHCLYSVTGSVHPRHHDNPHSLRPLTTPSQADQILNDQPIPPNPIPATFHDLS